MCDAVVEKEWREKKNSKAITEKRAATAERKHQNNGKDTEREKKNTQPLPAKWLPSKHCVNILRNMDKRI